MTTSAVPSAVSLLDETDVRKRLIQHGAFLAGIVTLAAAAALADERRAIALVLIALGLALLVLSALVAQRWEVRYRGHAIRFVNNPLRGEHLYIDGVRVAKGKLGLRSELRAALASGETLMVIADAGLVTYRCRMFVQSEVAPVATGALSDEQLLAEIRRRGIQA